MGKNLTENDLLKEYYEVRFEGTNMPVFNELTEQQKMAIEDTLGFTSFRFGYYFRQLSNPIKQKIVNLINKYIFNR